MDAQCQSLKLHVTEEDNTYFSNEFGLAGMVCVLTDENCAASVRP